MLAFPWSPLGLMAASESLWAPTLPARAFCQSHRSAATSVQQGRPSGGVGYFFRQAQAGSPDPASSFHRSCDFEGHREQFPSFDVPPNVRIDPAAARLCLRA